MKEKERKYFCLRDIQGTLMAHGTLYTQGNVVINWRRDIGHTYELYMNIGLTLNLMKGIKSLHILTEPPHAPYKAYYAYKGYIYPKY